MHTSYSAEKVAAQHRREMIEAARARGLAQQARRGTARAGRTARRVPRLSMPRRWLGPAVAVE